MASKKVKSSRNVVYVTRTECFSAAHRLHSKHLSAEENKLLFDKCNHVNGHGHNYKVDVTVRGFVDAKTGMAINISTLKETMKQILEALDHKCLDKDISYFADNVSTTENVAIYIWTEIASTLPESSDYKLYEVKVHETDKNVFIFRGETE